MHVTGMVPLKSGGRVMGVETPGERTAALACAIACLVVGAPTLACLTVLYAFGNFSYLSPYVDLSSFVALMFAFPAACICAAAVLFLLARRGSIACFWPACALVPAVVLMNAYFVENPRLAFADPQSFALAVPVAAIDACLVVACVLCARAAARALRGGGEAPAPPDADLGGGDG